MSEEDSTKSTYRLGKEYFDKKQYARAHEAFSEAAAAGYPPALRKLGLMYRSGLAVQKDINRAMDFFEKAAAQGDGYAKGFLGQLLIHGPSFRFLGNISHTRQMLRGLGLIFSTLRGSNTWED